MKYVPKIAGIGIGMVTALWMMAYWDVRQADILCDIGQDPNHLCQQRFIELERHKHILATNERKPAK